MASRPAQNGRPKTVGAGRSAPDGRQPAPMLKHWRPAASARQPAPGVNRSAVSARRQSVSGQRPAARYGGQRPAARYGGQRLASRYGGQRLASMYGGQRLASMYGDKAPFVPHLFCAPPDFCRPTAVFRSAHSLRRSYPQGQIKGCPIWLWIRRFHQFESCG
jgi:hypothetical protein